MKLGLHAHNRRLISALYTQSVLVDAAIAMHSSADPTLVWGQDVVLIMHLTACHTCKFFAHSYTPFLIK